MERNVNSFNIEQFLDLHNYTTELKKKYKLTLT